MSETEEGAADGEERTSKGRVGSQRREKEGMGRGGDRKCRDERKERTGSHPEKFFFIIRRQREGIEGGAGPHFDGVDFLVSQRRERRAEMGISERSGVVLALARRGGRGGRETHRVMNILLVCQAGGVIRGVCRLCVCSAKDFLISPAPFYVSISLFDRRLCASSGTATKTFFAKRSIYRDCRARRGSGGSEKGSLFDSVPVFSSAPGCRDQGKLLGG